MYIHTRMHRHTHGLRHTYNTLVSTQMYLLYNFEYSHFSDTRQSCQDSHPTADVSIVLFESSLLTLVREAREVFIATAHQTSTLAIPPKPKKEEQR